MKRAYAVKLKGVNESVIVVADGVAEVVDILDDRSADVEVIALTGTVYEAGLVYQAGPVAPAGAPAEGPASAPPADQGDRASMIVQIKRMLKIYGSQGIRVHDVISQCGFTPDHQVAQGTAAELQALIAALQAAANNAGQHVSHPQDSKPSAAKAPARGKKPAAAPPPPPPPPPPPADDDGGLMGGLMGGDDEDPVDETAAKQELIEQAKAILKSLPKAGEARATAICAAHNCGKGQDPMNVSLEDLNEVLNGLEELVAELGPDTGGGTDGANPASLVAGATEAAVARSKAGGVRPPRSRA